MHGLFVLFAVGAVPGFSERLATQLEQSFSRCEGAQVQRRERTVTLSVPKRCTFDDGRVVSGVVEFQVTEPAQADAPVRLGSRLIITAKALVFDSQQFDGVLLEGALDENDSVKVTTNSKRRAKVKSLPPQPGVRRVETREPPKDRRMDPIGDAAKDLGKALGALPVLIPSAMRQLASGIDAAMFAGEPTLVALWILAVPSGP